MAGAVAAVQCPRHPATRFGEDGFAPAPRMVST